MVDIRTEGKHTGEFLLSEGEGTISREKGTLLSGQVVADGTVLMLSAGKLKAHDGDLDSSGNAVTAAVGVVIGAHDASGGDLASVPYIARMAEIKDAATVYPANTNTDGDSHTVLHKEAVVASLKALFIIPR